MSAPDPERTPEVDQIIRERAAQLAREAHDQLPADRSTLRDSVPDRPARRPLQPGEPETDRRPVSYSYVRRYKARAARRRTAARVVEGIALAALVVAASALALAAPAAVFWAALAVLVACGLTLVVLLRPRATRVRRG